MLVQEDSVAFHMKSAEDRHTSSCIQAASFHQFSTYRDKSIKVTLTIYF